MPMRPREMFPFGLIGSTPFWERAAWYRKHYTPPAGDNLRMVAVGDQMEAATEEADDITRDIGDWVSQRQPDQNWRFNETYDLSEEARVRMYGLVMATADWSKQCPHMGSPLPAMALLRVGVIFCNECAEIVFAAAATGVLPTVAADDECDLCREHEPTNMFHPSVFQTGPMIIAGDLCDRCFGQLPTAELKSHDVSADVERSRRNHPSGHQPDS